MARTMTRTPTVPPRSAIQPQTSPGQKRTRDWDPGRPEPWNTTPRKVVPAQHLHGFRVFPVPGTFGMINAWA